MRAKEILGIIPARGGSKSIPHKNLYPLCGKALIEYTFDAAKGSRYFSRVILTTDDEETAEVGRRNGIEVPFLRPAHLALDDTPAVPVIRHVLDCLYENERYIPEVFVLLQPTSPLRTSHHIDEAVELLLETGADSVVSVVEVPHLYNPISVMAIRDGRLVPFIEEEGVRILRRQDKPKVYARNGAAVYAVKAGAFNKYGSLFGRDCRPYIMNPEESVDIDSSFDLKIAEMLIAYHLGRQGVA